MESTQVSPGVGVDDNPGDSRPKLVAGSPEGIPGHVDGRLREAKMNHPKGFTVDGRGNIYVADGMNMAVRKISDTGVTAIASGKSSRGGHIDEPSDDAKFSSDFEARCVASSCSLLVIDRGNQAIREIQLHFDDCVYQYEAGFPLGSCAWSLQQLVYSGFGSPLSGSSHSRAIITFGLNALYGRYNTQHSFWGVILAGSGNELSGHGTGAGVNAKLYGEDAVELKSIL